MTDATLQGTVLPERQPADERGALQRPEAGVSLHELSRRDITFPQLFFIALQLGLTVLVVSQFQLESRTFYSVAKLILVGFVIHSLLPMSLRLPFFTALSVASIYIALGLGDGITLVATGILLIAICHLPLSFHTRVVMLITSGSLLAIYRAGFLESPWSQSVWPILGSIFMFRLVIYMYAIRYEEARFRLSDTLAYFFMIPNACFSLFPVVDYSTFRKTHYDSDAYETYQRGMKWLVRGVVHLLVYRFVYMYWAMDPAQIVDAGDLLRYLLATFLLYLRVSGQFHLIVGILHLFGFRLPETHHLFYLASSFTDFWRRINIYWKDFMMKLFYYPSFFRLRSRGNLFALVGATLTVFLVTWILHSYQWFWLRGGFPVAAQDGLFWLILGVLVVITAVRESTKRRVQPFRPGSRWSATRALKVAGTFAAICILWSLWSAESIGEWVTMWHVAPGLNQGEMLAVLLFAVIGLAIAGREWDGKKLGGRPKRYFYQKPGFQCLAMLAGLLVFSQARLYAGPKLTAFVSTLRNNTLNEADAAIQQQGYYEKLDNVSRMSAQLWDLQSQRPPSWVAFHATEASRKRSDFLLEDIQPSIATEIWGAEFTSNRWGMRDRDYTLEKQTGTVRIALLGPSFLMGLGVDDEETFETIVEDRLNELRDSDAIRYELLNFGVGAYSLLQQLAMLEDRALAFKPDVVVVMLPEDKRISQAMINHLVSVMGEGIPIPYPELTEILTEAGIDLSSQSSVTSNLKVLSSRLLRKVMWKGLTGSKLAAESDLEKRIRSVNDRIVEWTLMRIAAISLDHGAKPLAIGLDIVRGRQPDGTSALRAAQRTGYVTINMFDVYDRIDPASLRLGVWDEHPNDIGHRIIADRLFEELLENDERLQLQLSASADSLH